MPEQGSTLPEFQINPTKDKIVSVPPRKLSPEVREQARSKLQDLKDQHVVPTSNSRFRSPIVVVMKKDGDIRVCVDYSEFNSYNEPHEYPLRDPTEIIQLAVVCSVFCTLDLRMG